MVVMTRARAKQQLEEEIRRREKEVQSGAVPNPVLEKDPDPGNLTKHQRREICRQMGGSGISRTPMPHQDLNISSEELQNLQEQDDSLKKAREAVDAASPSGLTGEIFQEGGIVVPNLETSRAGRWERSGAISTAQKVSINCPGAISCYTYCRTLWKGENLSETFTEVLLDNHFSRCGEVL